MKILSCGAGMQSSALHLMSCENALAKIRGEPPVWPQVPIYDISIFCDLGFEPPWVKKQVEFLANAGHSCGVPLVILDSPLYTDFMENFGERRTISIPWWTIKEDGHKSKMPRNCTIDYKVELISKYVRWELLGYKKGQRLRDEDKKAHEMHMGFSAEESRRCKESPNPMFVNKFPLVEMGLTRADNFAYIKDVGAWRPRLRPARSARSTRITSSNSCGRMSRSNTPRLWASMNCCGTKIRSRLWIPTCSYREVESGSWI